jgi:hypothetical protein
MLRTGFLILFLAATQLQAGWITWTNGTPGVTATGSFDGASGAYTGTVTAGLSNIVDGSVTGVPGLDARLYTNSELTTSFKQNYPVNPGGSFTTLANSYNDRTDAYTITLDFTGLANGYLPSGSLFAIVDLDIVEDYRNVTAYQGLTTISTNWLTAVTGGGALLDWYNIDGNQTGSVTGPSMSVSGGVYQFLGPSVNDNSALVGYRTTQDLTRMTIDFSSSAGGGGGTGGPGLAIGSDVPEPGTLTLFSIASLAGLLLRFRRTS